MCIFFIEVVCEGVVDVGIFIGDDDCFVLKVFYGLFCFGRIDL